MQLSACYNQCRHDGDIGVGRQCKGLSKRLMLHHTITRCSAVVQFSDLPPAYTMFVGPHTAEVHSSCKEDEPEGQQDQEAVTHRHHTLVVSVAGGVW